MRIEPFGDSETRADYRKAETIAHIRQALGCEGESIDRYLPNREAHEMTDEEREAMVGAKLDAFFTRYESARQVRGD